MLDELDLKTKLPRTEYKRKIEGLERKLGEAQREARRLEIPVVILFEGWEAAGKGTLINHLTLHLDARGFNVFAIRPPDEEERLRPFLWRFWNHLPGKGRIAILDRSWCGRILEERVRKTVKKKIWSRAFEEINDFELQLLDGNYLIIKFFLHIARPEQARRFKRLRKHPATRWRVTEDDLRQHKAYDKYLKAYGEMLERTGNRRAPWTLVPAHDRRLASVRVLETVIDRIRKEAVRRRRSRSRSVRLSARSRSVLAGFEPHRSLTRDDYEKRLKKGQRRLRELEHRIYQERVPVVIVYEGWDAGGKGGNIRRLVQRLDPRGYDVVPIGAPNEVEQRHHYLWRFWREFPKAGHIAIFDRSWYGRVLVERVEGFCREDEWKRAYREINQMEAQWTGFGTVIVKFWLQISPEEQLRRFEARQKTPHKQWKITEEDWRNRSRWEDYRAAVEDMLHRTSPTSAPWTVVEADSKLFARVKSIETVISAVTSRLGIDD